MYCEKKPVSLMFVCLCSFQSAWLSTKPDMESWKQVGSVFLTRDPTQAEWRQIQKRRDREVTTHKFTTTSSAVTVTVTENRTEIETADISLRRWCHSVETMPR